MLNTLTAFKTFGMTINLYQLTHEELS